MPWVEITDLNPIPPPPLPDLAYFCDIGPWGVGGGCNLDPLPPEFVILTHTH